MSNWKDELSGMISAKAAQTRAELENALFEKFLDNVALPAVSEIAQELNDRHDRDAQVRRSPACVSIQVRYHDDEEITFRVVKHFVQTGLLPSADVRLNKGNRYVKYESMFRPDPQNYPISDVTADDIIASFLKYYGIVMGTSSNDGAAMGASSNGE